MALESWVTDEPSYRKPWEGTCRQVKFPGSRICSFSAEFPQLPLDAKGTLGVYKRASQAQGTLPAESLPPFGFSQLSTRRDIAGRCQEMQPVYFLINWVMGQLRQAQYLCLINKLGRANARNWLMLKKETLAKYPVPASFPFQAAVRYSSQNLCRNSPWPTRKKAAVDIRYDYSHDPDCQYWTLWQFEGPCVATGPKNWRAPGTEPVLGPRTMLTCPCSTGFLEPL